MVYDGNLGREGNVMGIYMSSTAIIGVKFSLSEPVVTETVTRGCMNDESEAKFCSECGEPMWNNGTEYSHQFEDIEDEFIDPVLEKLNERFSDYAVVEPDNAWENFYIGYGVTCDNFEEMKIPVPVIF